VERSCEVLWGRTGCASYRSSLVLFCSVLFASYRRIAWRWMGHIGGLHRLIERIRRVMMVGIGDHTVD
jgi:hypothetical protein